MSDSPEDDFPSDEEVPHDEDSVPAPAAPPNSLPKEGDPDRAEGTVTAENVVPHDENASRWSDEDDDDDLGEDDEEVDDDDDR